MKEVFWTKTAIISLQETSNFIQEIWNSKINAEFLDQLDYRISQIQRNPELAPSFEDSDFRCLKVHKTISLFYTNNLKYIKLLLVWDNRMDPDKLLEKISESLKS